MKSTGMPRLGVVCACAFGDRLRAQAAAGDLDALRTLASSAPRDIPRRAVLAWRDERIRRLAADLFAALPGATRHSIAVILARAGHDLARHRSLTARKPFDRLLDDERGRLEARVLDLMPLAPPWPRLRRMTEIISLQF